MKAKDLIKLATSENKTRLDSNPIKEYGNGDRWVSPYTSASKKESNKPKYFSKLESSRLNFNVDLQGPLRNSNKLEASRSANLYHKLGLLFTDRTSNCGD